MIAFPFQMDGLSYDHETVTELREDCIKARDRALQQGKMNAAVNLSHIIAVLSQHLAALEKGPLYLEALEESVKLQSHYAKLLNMHDGGERMQFPNAHAWLARMEALSKEKKL